MNNHNRILLVSVMCFVAGLISLSPLALNYLYGSEYNGSLWLTPFAVLNFYNCVMNYRDYKIKIEDDELEIEISKIGQCQL